MARLQIDLIRQGCAQGKYNIKARGCILAVLSWGTADGPLADWSPFAYVPIDPSGNGSVFFPGMRSIPHGVTHVWARCISHDFREAMEISAEIAPRFQPPSSPNPDHAEQRFSILTDLHLSSKPWRTRQALRMAQSDVLLLLGDTTNDGIPSQFETINSCISEAAPNRILLPVIGNHDVTHPKDKSGDGCEDFAAFQDQCLTRAQKMGVDILRVPDSLAWSAQIGGLDVIGMQCVVSGRRFLFPEERQIEWLESHLNEHVTAAWHLILCHAPLLAHNPNRSGGQPYLDKNRRLQGIVDRFGSILFLSGHTHVSPNLTRGTAEWDDERHNLYLNCGSVVDTATDGDGGLMSADWKDGCVTELKVSVDAIEIDTRSVVTGTHFPRAYYRFIRQMDNDR